MKCKDCNLIPCQYRTSDGEQECYYLQPQIVLQRPMLTAEQINAEREAESLRQWEEFRRQTSAMILQALVNKNGISGDPRDVEDTAMWAVEYAEALIDELKK